MNLIALTEFYPTSEITYASELLYVCELGKYLHSEGYTLNLDGIILDDILRKSRFFEYLRVAVYNGWVTNVNLSEIDLALTKDNPFSLRSISNQLLTEEEIQFDSADIEARKDEIYNIVTPKKARVVFKSKTPEKWVWSQNNKDSRLESLNTTSICSGEVSQNIVSLIAYVAVKRFLYINTLEFQLDLSLQINLTQLGVVDLFLLIEKTNALQGWFFCNYNSEEDVQQRQGYEAWWYMGYEQGLCRREYDIAEKKKYLKQLGIQTGDIVGVYTRKGTKNKANYIKSIADFHFAFITISDKDISFEIINTTMTRFGANLEYDNLTSDIKKLLNYKRPSDTLNIGVERLPFEEVGIEHMLNYELTFVSRLQKGDVAELLVEDGKRGKLIENLSDVDYIYWLLKDYDSKHMQGKAEERFLKMYFSDGGEPVYNKYKRGELF